MPVLPGDGALVGHAGGIGPDSVKDYLERIGGTGDFLDRYGRSCPH